MLKKIMRNKSGSPIVEEMILIGVAVLVFVLLYALMDDILAWARDSIRGFF